MPEKIRIDIWGQIEGENDHYRIKPPDRVDIDASALGDGDSFERYFDECPCAIQRTRTVLEGDRKIYRKMVAYNDWALRHSLADSEFFPINTTPIIVYRQEILYTGGTQTFNAVAGTSSTFTLTGAALRYGSGHAAYVANSYYNYQAQINSSGILTANFSVAGTYNITAFLSAQLAKPVPVSIVINVS